MSHGLTVLDHMDFLTGNFCIYLLATIEVIFFAHIMGLDRGLKELASGAEMKLPKILPFILKFITPLFLIIIFGWWLKDQVFSNGPYIQALRTDPVVQLTIGFILITTLFFSLLIRLAVKRWNSIENVQREESI